MIGKIFAVLCIISAMFGAFSGNMYEVSTAALDGAGKAVTLTLGLCGAMALWGGVMRILEVKGAVRKFSVIFRPLLRILFPDACKKDNGVEEISATFAANMLGIGNAATPLAIRAMKKLDENRLYEGRGEDKASDDMVTFSVMNIAAFSLLPTTLLAMRTASGSADPFSVIPAVWICSGVSCAFAAFSCRLTNMIFPVRKRKKGRRKSTMIDIGK